MIDVFVNGISEERRAFVSYANANQRVYGFTNEPGAAYEVVLSSVQHSQLFHLANRDKVFVSTWNVDGICLYAQCRQLDYYLIASLLGLTQLRALNSCTLIPEDFIHLDPKGCLFSQHAARPDLAVKMQEPHVCSGCIAFYRCLGVERELDAVLEAITRIANRPPVNTRVS